MKVVLDNGILNVTLTTPEGMITAITYNGIDNLLEHDYHENQRGYTPFSTFCISEIITNYCNMYLVTIPDTM